MGGRVLDRDGTAALRRTAIALFAGAGGALMAPAGLLAADSPPMTAAAGTPVAAVNATPLPASAGKPVRLDASSSSEPGGAIVDYRWDLDGNGSYETATGARPFASTRFVTPGPARIGVRVTDARGATAESRLVVKVVARSRPQRRPSPVAAGGPVARASGPGPTVPGTGAGGAAPKAARHARASVRAAASGGVTIQSFAFHPGTTSISVGDSVTWTNQDSVSHTATANDGSFNTGVLKKGQSGSHTFTKAGTFAYICAIHPNMHGTIVVSGGSAGGSSSGGGGSGGGSGSGGGASSAGNAGSSAGSPGSSGSSAASGAAGSGSSLPHTGLELVWVLVLGGAMSAGGGALRRFARAG